MHHAIHLISRLLAPGLAFMSLPSLVLGSPVAISTVPYNLRSADITQLNLTPEQVQQDLGPILSSETEFFGPDDAEWAVATERWNIYSTPNISVVVEVGKESDVAEVVSRRRFPRLDVSQTLSALNMHVLNKPLHRPRSSIVTR